MDAIKHIRYTGIAENRKKAIMSVFEDDGEYTDRDVLNRLFPGSDNINNVQPRISELLTDGELEYIYDTRDKLTNRPVRVCRIKNLPSNSQDNQ